VIPLFKSQYSVGKSILTLENIVDIAEINSLQEIVLVEDSFYGFRAFNQAFQQKNIKFVFGLRISVLSNDSDQQEKPSKLILFAKNNDGLQKIKDIYTDAYTNKLESVIMSNYSQKDFKDIKIAVPFYDSYIYNNLFHFGMSNIDLSKLDHVYFVEDNNHPFDFQIRAAIEQLNQPTIEAKSIFYKNKEDFHAFQMYKAVCNRSQGKSPTFSNPNLKHFCSDEFCWESYKDATV
jgi:DNA polymerase III alpha subunit